MIRLVTIHTMRALALIAALTLCALPSPARAQMPFATPEEASDALAGALRTGELKRILLVLGDNSGEILSSGDAVADAETRKLFLAAWDARHQIAKDGDAKATLLVGSNDFPFPIPLVRTASMWRFDSNAGRQEILYRRIGRNEFAAIQTALAFVDAQNDYAEKDRTGSGAGVYAQRIVSNLGKRDGLYWPS